MPTYDYRCEKCGFQFEQFQNITAPPLKKCPECKRVALKRLIGTGTGIIFKGSGFYQTDYRTESYKKGQQAEQKANTSKEKKTEPQKAKAAAPSAKHADKKTHK
jgi:putative FmdB family regulatory protein